MPAKVIDKFNVDGEEYIIEPQIDPVPIENSQAAVMSGGVWQAIQDAAYSADFLKNPSVSAAVFGHMLGRVWKVSVSTSMNNAFGVVDNGNIIVTTKTVNSQITPAWSEDGKSWTDGTVTGGTMNQYCAFLYYGNNTWVIGTVSLNTLNIFTSFDGKAWSFVSSIAYSLFLEYETHHRIAYAFGKWWLPTMDGLQVSEDLSNWSIDSGVDWTTKLAGAFAVDYIDGKLLLNKGDGLWCTTDGTTWAHVTSSSNSYHVTYALGMCFMTCINSSNQKVITSYRLSDFTVIDTVALPAAFDISVTYLSFAGGYLFASQSNSLQVYSFCGDSSIISNILGENPVVPISNWSSFDELVRYANGIWICGNAYSTDLVHWIINSAIGDAVVYPRRAIYVPRFGRWVSSVAYSDVDVLKEFGMLAYNTQGA